MIVYVAYDYAYSLVLWCPVQGFRARGAPRVPNVLSAHGILWAPSTSWMGFGEVLRKRTGFELFISWHSSPLGMAYMGTLRLIYEYEYE